MKFGTPSQGKEIYMTDDSIKFEKERENRLGLYSGISKGKWREAEATIDEIRGERILRILGHNVMADYQYPYMKKLTDIVTQNGGHILNIGYGLGIVDQEIEKIGVDRGVESHTIIELNDQLAQRAQEESNDWKVVNDDWKNALPSFEKGQFDGILYDGYPINPDEMHRDGIDFIRKIMEKGVLKKGGVLTFFVDAEGHMGNDFIDFLKNLGFSKIEVEEVEVDLPERKMQRAQQKKFLAPTLIF